MRGKRPKNATHAASLIKRTQSPTLLVQPGKRKIAEVIGPEASDLAVVGRINGRGVLGFVGCLWLLHSIIGAPASWIHDYSYRSQSPPPPLERARPRRLPAAAAKEDGRALPHMTFRRCLENCVAQIRRRA